MQELAENQSQRAQLITVVLWTALYIAVEIIVAGIRGVNPLIVSLVATFPFMFLWMMVIASVTRLRIGVWQAVLALLVFGAGSFSMRILGIESAASFLLMFAGILIGYLVSMLITDRNILLPVAIVAAAVDVWGVYFGTTHMVLNNAPQVIGSVSASVPAGHEVGPMLRVGFGDFVFLGLFLTSIQRFDMNFRRNFILLYTLLSAALVWVLLTAMPVPALAPMGLAVVVANVREFRLSRQEWMALLYSSLFILALFLLTKHFRG